MIRLHEAIRLAGGAAPSASTDDAERARTETSAPVVLLDFAPDAPRLPEREQPKTIEQQKTIELPVAAPVPVEASQPRRRSLVWVACAAAVLLAVGAGRFFFVPAGAETLKLTGIVVANRVAVAAKAAGRIERLNVDEGHVVAAGDVIAVLDRAELEAERRDQLAVIEQLNAKLEQSRERVVLEGERGRNQVASAEAEIKASRSQRTEVLAMLAQSRRESERRQNLYNAGIISRQDVEQGNTDLEVAVARLAAVEDQIARAEADHETARANARQADIAERDVEQTLAQIRQAEAQVAQVDARLSHTEIRAPLAGTISLRAAREGEVVRAGDPIVTIVDLDDIWVRAEIEESLMRGLKVGQPLEVEIASGERVTGRVSLIEAEAQFATQRDVSRTKRDVRTFGVKVTLPNADRRLHPGITAYVLVPPSLITAAAP